MKTRMTLTTLAFALILAGIGCGGDTSVTDPCNGQTTLSGVYESDSPDVTMALEQCGAQVTGVLTSRGVNHDVAGEVSGDTFSWTAAQVDLCGTAQATKRAFYSNRTANHFQVMNGGASFEGSYRMTEANCSTSRVFNAGFTTTFQKQ